MFGTMKIPFRRNVFGASFFLCIGSVYTGEAAVTRGQANDLVADVVLGQPDYQQMIPGEIVPFKVAGPSGVQVDRTVRPNRVYVYDGMNSRILGFASLGVCQNNAAVACTADSDCPGSICKIQVGGETGAK